ncbi:MAG TPA: EscU/YscU/HrcU family type III secretion system export apparatus switch protein, partial [Steroidobacteraceae bacterium]|nr:EscU/YscU/HrcU family type III secretion system export apparatus switch protein [Steroidobacteraceae bacterium]
MQQEQELNRTEEATPFKLTEAKKRGQVAKSLDFNTLIIVATLVLAMTIWGARNWRALGELCSQLFVGAGDFSFTDDSMPATLRVVATHTLDVLLPFLVVGVVAAILANLVQTGPIFSVDPLKPKFERLNPAAGFKRVFNKRMLF